MNAIRATQKPRRIGSAVTLVIIAALLTGSLFISPSGSVVLAQRVGEPVDVLVQDGGGTVYFVPNPAYVNKDETVTIEIWLNGADNLYGLDIRFTFEKAKVSVVPVPYVGPVLPLWDLFDEVDNFLIKNTLTSLDDTYSQVWYAVTNTKPAPAIVGDGRVGSITFKGLAAGTTPLHFTYALAGNPDMVELSVAVVDGSITVGDPTAVTISQFAARPVGRSIRILWSTEQEIDLLGFNLYRAEGSDGEPLLLNETLIPSKSPGSPAGAQYAYADLTVESGVRYHYWLDFVHFDGTTTRYGPLSAAGLQRLGPSIQ